MIRIKNAFVHFILLFLRNAGTYYVMLFNKWLKLKVTCCRFCPTFSKKNVLLFQCLGRDPVFGEVPSSLGEVGPEIYQDK